MNKSARHLLLALLVLLALISYWQWVQGMFAWLQNGRREMFIAPAANTSEDWAKPLRTWLGDTMDGRAVSAEQLSMQYKRGGWWRDIHALRPAQSARGDEGRYALRDRFQHDLLLQAPHAEFDRMTGTIASKMFLEHEIQAIAMSSSPRYLKSPDGPANDLARRDDTLFQAFTTLFAELNPKARVVQLHGFDRELRNDQAARSADVIISAGRLEVSGYVRRVAHCLQDKGWVVRVFPDDTRELGALSNQQAKALHAARFAQFAHLELSLQMRERLAQSKPQRAELLSCL